jgi:hypothetical protein
MAQIQMAGAIGNLGTGITDPEQWTLHHQRQQIPTPTLTPTTTEEALQV